MATALDERALLEDIKALVLAATWTVDDSTIFGPNSVVVTPADVAQAITQRRTPLALIRTEGGPADDEEPDLSTVTVVILIVVIDRRDELGEIGMIGATDEKGLLQASHSVRVAINKLHRTGVPIIFRRASDGAAQVADIGPIVYRELRFTAQVADEDEAVGAGNWTLSFTTQPVNAEVDATMADVVVTSTRGGSVAITIALVDEMGATLSGTLTRTAVAGVATFDDLQIDTINTGYQFVATCADHNSVTSSTFDITGLN